MLYPFVCKLLLYWHGFCDVGDTLSKYTRDVHLRSDSTVLTEAIPIGENPCVFFTKKSYMQTFVERWSFSLTFEPRHVTSKNVAFDKCRLRRAGAASFKL